MKLNRQNNFKLMALSLVDIAAGLVTLASFGTINPMWRYWIIYSDWWGESETEPLTLNTEPK